jgi:hypothetical protein
MSLDVGLWLLTAAPATLWLGPWAAVAIAGSMLALSAGTKRIFSAAEKREMLAFAAPYLERLNLRRRSAAGS